MFGNAVHLYAGNRNPGRVWQYGNSTTLAIGTRAACGNMETGPRVAIHARVSWSCAATHVVRGKTQPRGANTCQLWPAPRVAIHAGNQCRVWQYTLAIRKGGRVWQSTLANKKGPRVAITRLPVPRVAGPMRGSGTTKFIPPRR